MQKQITPEDRWERLVWAYYFAQGQTFLPLNKRFRLLPGNTWEERLIDIRRDLSEVSAELSHIPLGSHLSSASYNRPC